MNPNPDQIEQFNRDGYLICRGLASQADCAAMLAVTRVHLEAAIEPLEYEADLGYPGAPGSRDAAGGSTIRRLRGAWQRDPVFRAWASDPRIVNWLERRFGEPVCVTLAHHNCVMTKHPAYGTATGWHRDIRYWAFARPDLVAVWLALGPEGPSNGGLSVIPGSHRMDIRREQLDALDFLRPDVAENRALMKHGVALELEAGDVVFFHSGLFHAAGRNASDQVKCSVVFAYRAASNPPVTGSRSAAGDGGVCF
ncbi:MAG TPA: phytanoyl-CoA dioxygenase family protein [Noviherbaspirillum sp.]|nr:phytanoyl-CoA dioxygenase family protein [Noviherbaspirillum sp.]